MMADNRTIEHRRMAEHIDARIKLCESIGLLEVEILGEMADCMPDFHHLIQHAAGAEMDALCQEYSGFYRYAKILETLAAGIASGKVKIPGKKTLPEADLKSAATIDLRVRQLEAKGIQGPALLGHMVGYVLDLQRLWSSTSDQELAKLCRDYPGLYRFGILMEEAAEIENQKAKTAYGHLPPLPESIKTTVAELLTNGAALERGFQSILDAQGQRDMWLEIEVIEDHHAQWMVQFAGLPGELRAANITGESRALLMQIFEPMAQRINQLHGQVFAK